jgi:DNA-binding NarL/FixJ family response regulator
MSHDVLSVVIADDHELFRRGLVRLLAQAGMEVVGEAADGVQAVQRCTELQPDVVVMDLHMPAMSGIDATRRIVAAGLRTQVAVLTVSAEESMVIDALVAGACGYLLKDAEADQVVTAIQAAARGESVISPRVAAKVVNRLRREPRLQSSDATTDLTERETVVLRLMATGLGNHEIADQLVISENTVKNHVSNILMKLDVDNRVQATVRAIVEGLIDPAEPAWQAGGGSGQ